MAEWVDVWHGAGLAVYEQGCSFEGASRDVLLAFAWRPLCVLATTPHPPSPPVACAAVWQQGTGGGRAARGRKAPQRGKAGSGKPAGPRTATASRALAILELVGGRVASWEAAQQLTDALLPLLQPREGAGGRRRQGKGDEQLVARTLAVLGALWSRLPPAELHQRLAARQQLVAVAAALAPLAGNLQARDAR